MNTRIARASATQSPIASDSGSSDAGASYRWDHRHLGRDASGFADVGACHYFVATAFCLAVLPCLLPAFWVSNMHVYHPSCNEKYVQDVNLLQLLRIPAAVTDCSWYLLYYILQMA